MEFKSEKKPFYNVGDNPIVLTQLFQFYMSKTKMFNQFDAKILYMQ